ncbi:MAG: hypothetical protein HY520_02620 [Candidatus Aenigmarchaeota archaeon]|nr:hypothetical protein [Candidatus Aenigmarchaeota archaeon]
MDPAAAEGAPPTPVPVRTAPWAYKNFWLIWLTAAGAKRTTLYKVQERWGITTNYLYHREAGLGKTLLQEMVDTGHMAKEGRFISAQMGWIPAYIQATHPLEKKEWSPSLLVLRFWPLLQPWAERERERLFGPQGLQMLYRSGEGLIRSGHAIFHDLFLLALTANISLISQKYKARVVERILHTFLALLPDRDLLAYYQHLLAEGSFPTLIKDEQELLDTLSPWVKL